MKIFSEALLTENSLAEYAIAVKPKILYYATSLGEGIPYVLGNVRVTCQGDQPSAHIFVGADQIHVGHITVIEGANARGIDLEWDILFDDSIENGKDLFLKERDVDISFVFAVDVAQRTGQMGKHVKIRFVDHFLDMEKVFFHKTDELLLGRGGEIDTGIAVVDLLEGNAVDGAEDHVKFTERKNGVAVFGIKEVFRHFHALQDLKTVSVDRFRAANVLHTETDLLGRVQLFGKPHIHVVADRNALQAFLNGALADLVDRLLAVDGTERMNVKVKHKKFLS